MRKKTKVYIGTSGYNYKHWSGGVFYPMGLTQDGWLEHYARFFNTVELNVTFYRLPQESAFRGWYKRTPKGFAFTVKGSRFITHIKRLKDCREPVGLLHRRMSLLKEKLSCVLWQLPPKFEADIKRLEVFLRCLKVCKARHVFEFRHESWFSKDIYGLLREHNACLCLADWPIIGALKEATADFAYVRRHGAGEVVYGGCYSDRLLKEDARDIKGWLREGRDTYIYFNNDAGGYAVKNALTLKELVREGEASG